MRKRLVASVITLTMMAGVLTACGKTSISNNSSSTEVSTDEGNSVTTGENIDNPEDNNEVTEETTGNIDDNTENLDDITVIKYNDPAIIGNLPDIKPDVSEDYYLNINYDAIKEMKLPEGHSEYGTFSQLADEAEKCTLGIINNGDLPSEYSLVSDFYNMYIDMDSRNEAGFGSVMPYIEKITSISNLDELYDTLYYSGGVSTFADVWGCYVSADMKDSVNNILCVCEPGLDLGDSAEYSKMSDYGTMIKEADDNYYKKLLAKAGFDEEKATEIISERFELEKKLAQHMYDLETSYREDFLEMNYNQYTMQDFYELAGDFPFESIFENFNLAENEKLIVNNPEFFENLQNIIVEDNLEEIKSYFILSTLKLASQYTDEEAYSYYNEWKNAKSGSTGSATLEKLAYEFVCDSLGELVGQIYAEKYFSPEEKADVEKIVYDFIDVYRTRLEENDWLSEATKNTAIEKLDNMGVYIGYPDVLMYDYSDIEIDKEKDLFCNYCNYINDKSVKMYQNAGQPVNKAAWGSDMPANVVNACYSPTTNSIYFPAAILQAPFYSKDASFATNMGGIGMVIGHEITHAFDTMGSQYDKDGNMVNWWTKEDRAAFSEKTKAVGEMYGSYELVEGYRVNGDLTIGETVADLGGVTATLQILENKENEGELIDYKDFFETDAKVWLRIMTKESRINRLKNDPHAPELLRVNVNLTQFDKFYEVYDVKEGDPMYIAPEDRLMVW